MDPGLQTVDPEKARAFLDRKRRNKAQAVGQLYDQAVRDFEAIRGMIVDRYQPVRIYQWGSLLDRAKFRDYSDIDISVEGVNDPELFFKMFGEAEKMTTFSLDLLDHGKLAPEFAQIIQRKGVLVYERGIG